VGPVRVVAFGTSIVAPAGSVVTALWTIDLVIVLAGLGFVTAAVNAGIRVLYAMGRDRVLPAALGRLSRRQTPIVAIGCLAAVALVLGLPLTSAYGGGAHIRVSRRRGRVRGRARLHRREHCRHPRVPHRVPRRVQARAASSHPGRGHRGIPVPAVGHRVSRNLHPDEPAALYRPGMAPRRRHRRGHPAGAAARHVRDAR
jgi:hypothetical protein